MRISVLLNIILQRGVSSKAPDQVSGLRGWWDATDAATMYTDAGVTLVSADGDAVYRITDKSGGGRYFEQATSANRPLYKTNRQNGKSGLQFTGTSHSLGGRVLSDFFAAGAKTLIVAFKTAAHNNNMALFGDTAGYFNVSSPTGGTWQALNFGASENSTGVSSVIGTAMVYSFWHKSGSLYDQKNLNAATAGVVSGDTSSLTSACYLGGLTGTSVLFNGDMYMAAAWNVAISDADRNAVVQYMIDQLGVS